jgi:hypothetical protein
VKKGRGINKSVAKAQAWRNGKKRNQNFKLFTQCDPNGVLISSDRDDRESKTERGRRQMKLESLIRTSVV